MGYDYKAMASVRPPKRTDAPIQTVQRYMLPESEAPEFSKADERMLKLVERFIDNTEIVMSAKYLYQQGIYPTIAGLAKVVMMREGSTSFAMSKEIADAMGLPYQDGMEMVKLYDAGLGDGFILEPILIRYKVIGRLDYLRILYKAPK